MNNGPGAAAALPGKAGYGAFTVSPSQLPVLTEYVERQEEHHRGQPFQDEYVAILKKHGVEYDERYLFDEAGE